MMHHIIALLHLYDTLGRFLRNASGGTGLLEYRHPLVLQQHVDLTMKLIPSNEIKQIIFILIILTSDAD